MGAPLHRLPAHRCPGPMSGCDRGSFRWPISAPRPNAFTGSPPERRSCHSDRPRTGVSSRPNRSSRSGRSSCAVAYAAVSSLSAAELARGVITYSSGNHAQGVARAARLLGAPAVIVMPSDAPDVKRQRVAADGAEIVVVGTASDERQRVAEEIAAERGLVDHPAVRRRPDHRRAGHGRTRDRGGPAGRRRRPRAGRRRRTGQRRGHRDPGPATGAPASSAWSPNSRPTPASHWPAARS